MSVTSFKQKYVARFASLNSNQQNYQNTCNSTKRDDFHCTSKRKIAGKKLQIKMSEFINTLIR